MVSLHILNSMAWISFNYVSKGGIAKIIQKCKFTCLRKSNKMEEKVKLTCRADAFEIQDGSRQGVLFRASYVVSLAFPQSTTKTISLIVMLASAMFVARTIFRTLGGGFSKINFCNQNQTSW